jgi:hypothetical protein
MLRPATCRLISGTRMSERGPVPPRLCQKIQGSRNLVCHLLLATREMFIMELRGFLAAFPVGLSVLVFTGCSYEIDRPQHPANNPVGPLANNALEAWPQKPDPPPLTREQIGRACVAWAACDAPGLSGVGVSHQVLLVDVCIDAVEWSAERAIPLGPILTANERAEYFVSCVLELEAAQDCGAIAQCVTERSPHFRCGESGCVAPQTQSVFCDGALAKIDASGGAIVRDCARSVAQCDSSSPTGCTDRPLTQCPPDGTGADRCDGNVRLGCDYNGQVSYLDCERLGGTCGQLDDGGFGCLYASPQDPPCASVLVTCNGDQVTACVTGVPVTVPGLGLCGG